MSNRFSCENKVPTKKNNYTVFITFTISINFFFSQICFFLSLQLSGNIRNYNKNSYNYHSTHTIWLPEWGNDGNGCQWKKGVWWKWLPEEKGGEEMMEMVARGKRGSGNDGNGCQRKKGMREWWKWLPEGKGECVQWKWFKVIVV